MTDHELENDDTQPAQLDTPSGDAAREESAESVSDTVASAEPTDSQDVTDEKAVQEADLDVAEGNGEATPVPLVEVEVSEEAAEDQVDPCLLYTSPSPRDRG